MSDGFKWRRICSLCGVACFFYSFQNPFLNFNHRHLCWRSSFFLHLLAPLPLLIFTALPLLMFSVFRSSSPHESRFVRTVLFSFEYKWSSPQFTSAHLLACFLSAVPPALSWFDFLLCRHILCGKPDRRFYCFSHICHPFSLSFTSLSQLLFATLQLNTVQLHTSLFASAFHCSTTLGMESGKISDDQISASTTFYDNRWLPRQARLNNNDNAWTPSEDSNKEYIQVRLYHIFNFSAPGGGRSQSF